MYLITNQSINQSINEPISQSVSQSVRLSVCQSVSNSLSQWVFLSVSLPVCRPVGLLACRSVVLPVSSIDSKLVFIKVSGNVPLKCHFPVSSSFPNAIHWFRIRSLASLALMTPKLQTSRQKMQQPKNIPCTVDSNFPSGLYLDEMYTCQWN